MTEFIAGFLAGCFFLVALATSFAGWAACAVGGRYDDDAEQYDPERAS